MHPLLERFESRVAAGPRRAAASDPSLALDYASLRSAAVALATRIREHDPAGASPHVGILAPTSTIAAAAILGCWYAGRVPVPLNFLLSPGELAGIVRDAGLRLVLTIEHFAPQAAQLSGLGVRSLTVDAKSLAAPATPAVPPASAAPTDTGVILYTSGTSGTPKGVCLSFDNLVRNVETCIEHMRIPPDAVLLSVLPQFHSFGFTAMTLVPLLLGASVWYLPRFSPTAVVGMIAEKRITVFMAVASMYAALLQLKQVEPGALGTLTLAISGGEPLAPAVASAFEERFGVEICEGYGLTETSPVVSINQPWDRRPGSVGRPLPGVEVIAADVDGRALPVGQQGELLIRGHNVMRGYYNQPWETANVLRGGVLRTGDLGYVDRDGFVFITGRAKELIIIGGENVHPREIEVVLAEHPAVAEAAVVGRPDALRGDVPIAFVLLKPGLRASALELREHCRTRLAGYKVPREVHVADDLPRGPTGKILKRALPGRQTA
jgi:long-chain acyl-CoA synthetase